MTTVADFTTPSNEFRLGSLFRDCPRLRIELDRVVPTGDAVFPYFWTRGTDVELVERALEAVRSVHSVSRLDSVDRTALFRAAWRPGGDELTAAIVSTDVTLLAAIGTADGWRFQLRGTTDAVSTFHQRCRETGVDVTLDRLRRPALVADDDRTPQITPEQQEAFAIAYERGYYEEPRGTTLSDVAAELAISRQAVGARLRRGHRRLVRSFLRRNGRP